MAVYQNTSTGERPRGGWRWLRILLIGLVLWVLCIVIMLTTNNINFVPTVILLGSFLVPVAALVFDFDHRASANLSAETVISAFILGGLLGVLAAGTLEAWLVRPGVWEYLEVGLIEEFAKLAALVVIARRLTRYTMRDGIVLGAAVGFGFAALESSGYAFNAMLTNSGLSVSDLVMTEVMRGVLAPVGHGLWTAILGAVLFGAASALGRLRLTAGVAGAYVLVSVLHGLWDSMSTLALLVTLLVTATPTQAAATAAGRSVRPTAGQAQIFEISYWSGEAVVSLIGLAVLAWLWHRAGREPLTGPVPRPEPRAD